MLAQPSYIIWVYTYIHTYTHRYIPWSNTHIVCPALVYYMSIYIHTHTHTYIPESNTHIACPALVYYMSIYIHTHIHTHIYIHTLEQYAYCLPSPRILYGYLCCSLSMACASFVDSMPLLWAYMYVCMCVCMYVHHLWTRCLCFGPIRMYVCMYMYVCVCI